MCKMWKLSVCIRATGASLLCYSALKLIFLWIYVSHSYILMTLLLLAPSFWLATLVAHKWDVTFQPKEKRAEEADNGLEYIRKNSYTDFNGLCLGPYAKKKKVVYEGQHKKAEFTHFCMPITTSSCWNLKRCCTWNWREVGSSINMLEIPIIVWECLSECGTRFQELIFLHIKFQVFRFTCLWNVSLSLWFLRIGKCY